MAMIKGCQITLYKRTESDRDSLNHINYVEEPIKIENVLVEPVSADDLISDQQLEGSKVVYRLHIPKTDNNDWENVRVEIYGQMFKTYGTPMVYMDYLTPLDWDKKVLVERYE